MLREGGLLPSKKSLRGGDGGGWYERITNRGLRPSQFLVFFYVTKRNE